MHARSGRRRLGPGALTILALVGVAAPVPAALAREAGQPDLTPPTATLNQAAGQLDPTSTGPILFTLVFSEPVIGLEDSDVTVAVSNMTQYGTVVVQLFGGVVTDLAGNPNLSAAFTDRSVEYAPPPDTIRPTVTRSLSSPAPPGVYTLQVTAYNSCGPSQAAVQSLVVP
jgi:hypothetical protein